MATIITHIKSDITEEQRKRIEEAIRRSLAGKVSCEILYSNIVFEDFIEGMRVLKNNKVKEARNETVSILTIGVVVAGMHRYPESTRSYLREFHRHDFKISVNIGVTELNRQYEFYDVQDGILETLNAYFPKVDKTTHNFGNRSCEHIANELFPVLAKKYPVLHSIAVFEDDFNGSIVLASYEIYPGENKKGLIVPPGDE